MGGPVMSELNDAQLNALVNKLLENERFTELLRSQTMDEKTEGSQQYVLGHPEDCPEGYSMIADPTSCEQFYNELKNVEKIEIPPSQGSFIDGHMWWEIGTSDLPPQFWQRGPTGWNCESSTKQGRVAKCKIPENFVSSHRVDGYQYKGFPHTPPGCHVQARDGAWKGNWDVVWNHASAAYGSDVSELYRTAC